MATSELAPFSNPVPIDTPLSMNVTVPVGVPAPGLKVLTVAVKVTLCPNTEAFVEEATVVVVCAFTTVWCTPPTGAGREVHAVPTVRRRDRLAAADPHA